MEAFIFFAMFIANQAALAVSTTSGGVTFPTTYVYTAKGGREVVERLPAGEASVVMARSRLTSNPDKASMALLMEDDYIQSKNGRVRAILIEARGYLGTQQTVKMSIPYQQPSIGRPFVVAEPSVTFTPPPAGSYPKEFMEAFWRGVSNNKAAEQIWKSHLGQPK